MTDYIAPTTPDITPEEMAHERLARRAGAECVVLLENDGTLPFKGGGPIALFGSGARNTVRGGTGSGEVNARRVVSVEEGLADAGFEIVTTRWLDAQDAAIAEAKRAYFEDFIRPKAAELGIPEFLLTFDHPFKPIDPIDPTAEDFALAEIVSRCVYVVARNSGEGADRKNEPGDYQFSEAELTQIEALAKVFDEFVIVLNVGGVMELTPLLAIDGIGAIVLMGQLGSVGGLALADVVTGAVNPSGKLTDTWARAYGDYPSSATFSANDGDVDDEYYSEGIYVGYRYFDSFGVEPLYPFGFGRSYTTFEFTATDLELDSVTARVKVAVKNTGPVAGREVVQVYAATTMDHLPKAAQVLVGYHKTELIGPGETVTVEVPFDVRAMASYCANHSNWAMLGGDYIIQVGACSRATAAAGVLTLAENTPFKHLKPLFAEVKPPTVIAAPASAATRPESVPVIPIDPAMLGFEAATYQDGRPELAAPLTKSIIGADDVIEGRATVEELVAQLSVEELATLCVGTLRSEGGSIVGNASAAVPGAAGDTSPCLKATRGVKNLVMADGPAGLRLQPVFRTDLDGNLLPGGELMGDSYTPFDPSLTDENSIAHYQYCTAIPIGWMLAQSWDPTLLEELGDMVGAEMETFGVDIWLAPALNIHRNPLCGRNFEYYSEDPLVAGRCAAAITRGVQRHAGKYVCLKHYAANNQEDNRYFTNSHVGEQALREIYLKGFEIAIREAQPATIMTSYNLLNGVHTANSYDLLQTVARDENGFKGFVMTDWFTSQDMPSFTGTSTKYPISASTGCVYAGNDVQMPGCQGNVDDLVRAVETGEAIDGFKVTKGDLQFCAANVIRVVLGLA